MNINQESFVKIKNGEQKIFMEGIEED